MEARKICLDIGMIYAGIGLMGVDWNRVVSEIDFMDLGT
jgi:hypothetical protein